MKIQVKLIIQKPMLSSQIQNSKGGALGKTVKPTTDSRQT